MLVHSILACLLAAPPSLTLASDLSEDSLIVRAITTSKATPPSKSLLRRDGSLVSSSTTLPTTTIIVTVTSYSTTVTETVSGNESSPTTTSSLSTTTLSSTTESSTTSSSDVEPLTSTSSTTTSVGPAYTSCTDLEQNFNPYPINGKPFLVQCENKGFDNIYLQQITDTFVECADLCAQDSGCAAMDYFPNNDGTGQYTCEFASNNEGQYYPGCQAAAWQQTGTYTTVDTYQFNTAIAQFYNYGDTPLVIQPFMSTSYQDCMDTCGEYDDCYFVNYYAISTMRQCELIPNGNYPLQNSGDYNSSAYVSGRPSS